MNDAVKIHQAVEARRSKEIANTEKRIHPNEGGLELPVGIDLRLVPGYLSQTVETYRRGAIAQGNKVFILPPWISGCIGASTAQALKDSAALTPATPPPAFTNESTGEFANMIGPVCPIRR